MMAGRIRWAGEGLGLTGGERVLEVGPGHGVALDLCAQSLDTGLAAGLDRSAKMIAACAKRNAAHIEAGRVELIEGTPDTSVARLGRFAPFDRVLALRVRAFADAPGKTLGPLLPDFAAVRVVGLAPGTPK